ncbi:hypothetical protein G5V59_19775 [Nocardioides sp. W3-2-3]|uniref:hypothetical protein n=1 Tax=Nocardioides convexus TaxID=2712224 RepID=UPI0024183876|nr:hypothetical protein [Nocardioides convexus]NHA01326.1 hypothetical protein [Nocardioides convexus]
MIERWGALVVRRAIVVLLVGLGITAAAAIAGIGLEDKARRGWLRRPEQPVGARA